MSNLERLHRWLCWWERIPDTHGRKWAPQPAFREGDDAEHLNVTMRNAMRTKDKKVVRRTATELIRSPMLYSRSRPAKYRKPRACPVCGKIAVLTRDHWVPKAQGGTNSNKNIVWMCFRCNQAKGAKQPEQVGVDLLPRTERRELENGR